MIRNSTIQPRTGICPLCADHKKKPLIRGLCERHYWEQNRIKSFQKTQQKVIDRVPGLRELIDAADEIFSRYVRLNVADEYGRCECFTCGEVDQWQKMQAGHFIPRANMYTRYLEQNVKPQCQTCNEYKDGNLIAYAERLEKEHPGSVQLLQEQARIVYHYSKDELKRLISEYSMKVKKLK